MISGHFSPAIEGKTSESSSLGAVCTLEEETTIKSLQTITVSHILSVDSGHSFHKHTSYVVTFLLMYEPYGNEYAP